MVQTSKKARKPNPTPAPRTPLAKRLEHVRNIRGVSTLSDFHRKLTEERAGSGKFAVSYAAVRNYHHDREAPAAYLVRVADVFSVRLRWLLTGDGEPTELETAMEAGGELSEEDRRTERTIRMMRASFIEFQGLPEWALRVLWQTVLHYGAYKVRKGVMENGPMSEDKEAQTLIYTAAEVALQMASPLKRMYPGHPSLLSTEQLTEYVLGYCQLIRQLVPSEGPFLPAADGEEPPKGNA